MTEIVNRLALMYNTAILQWEGEVWWLDLAQPPYSTSCPDEGYVEGEKERWT
jgi:hypothetical protein